MKTATTSTWHDLLLCEQVGWKEGTNLNACLLFAMGAGLDFQQTQAEMIAIGIHLEYYTYESARVKFDKELDKHIGTRL